MIEARKASHLSVVTAVCGLGFLCAACGGGEEASSGRSSSDGQSPLDRIEVAGDTGVCDTPEARTVTQQLGERLKQVPLLAADSVVRPAIREAFRQLVTPDLLDTWIADPSLAPGRDVSSPWPERIEVGSVEPVDGGGCRVRGDVVYVTSVEAAGAEGTRSGAALRRPVTLHVVGDDDGRIAAYESTGPAVRASRPTSSGTGSAGAAAEILTLYYRAIDNADFRRAYGLWASEGRASGQTFEEFASGFADIEGVEVEIGTPGRIEPAAGSRYVPIPVTVRARMENGDERRYEGTYTLRRSVVDGASVEQRTWRIYSSEITRIP